MPLFSIALALVQLTAFTEVRQICNMHHVKGPNVCGSFMPTLLHKFENGFGTKLCAFRTLWTWTIHECVDSRTGQLCDIIFLGVRYLMFPNPASFPNSHTGANSHERERLQSPLFA